MSFIVLNSEIVLDLPPQLDRKLIVSNQYIHYSSNSFTELADEDNIYLVNANESLTSLDQKDFQDIKNVDLNNFLLKLVRGFILKISRLTPTFELIIDPYGLYPIFYVKNNENFLISDSFSLLKQQINTELNPEAIFDLFLFHSVQLNRTIEKKIQKLSGNSKIIFDGNTITEVKNSFFDFSKSDATDDFEKFANIFSEHLDDNINSDLPTYLTLTGGFDSRTLLALLLNRKHSFKTFTWGQKGNLQERISSRISKDFNIEHISLEFDSSFFDRQDEYCKRILSINSFNPIILDLPQFCYTNDILEKGNIIMGLMGSEIIRGPVVSSGTTFTNAANILLNSEFVDIEKEIKKILEQISILNFSEFDLHNYLNSFSPYFKDNRVSNRHIFDYLIHEKLAKYYSCIINLHLPKHNLINPFLDTRFIELYLRNQANFFSKDFTRKSAYRNFKSYQFYGKLINILSPILLNTTVDRGYKIKDLLSVWGYGSLFFHYLKNHSLKYKQIRYPKILDYSNWFQSIVLDKVNNSPLLDNQLFSKAPIKNNIELYKNRKLSDFNAKKLIILTGIDYYTDS